MRRIYLIILTVALASLCSCAQKSADPVLTVVVSLDGCRWDYADMYGAPGLDAISAEGVKAVMKPSYPASTFPNHYAIATGLVPDHHGIVNNKFWDPRTQARYAMGDIPTRSNPAYYGGEPIWVTAEKQGVRTASIYWVGTDIPICGTYPSYWHDWYEEPQLSYPERVQEAIRLASLPARKRPRLIMVYFDDPDHAGHVYGPMADETRDMFREMDALMGELYKGLKALRYGDRINLIVTSDHGMASISPERFICVDDYIKEEWYDHMITGTPTSIFSKPGCQEDILKALEGVEHISVWRKEEVPEHLNYGTSERLGDIIVAPDLGWLFDHKVRKGGGAHGYDPEEPDMQVIFRATGPSFKKGFVMEDKFVNVDIYGMLCGILGIEPAPTDGKPERIAPILAE